VWRLAPPILGDRLTYGKGVSLHITKRVKLRLCACLKFIQWITHAPFWAVPPDSGIGFFVVAPHAMPAKSSLFRSKIGYG
jgi:hypothetical protein